MLRLVEKKKIFGGCKSQIYAGRGDRMAEAWRRRKRLRGHSAYQEASEVILQGS